MVLFCAAEVVGSSSSMVSFFRGWILSREPKCLSCVIELTLNYQAVDLDLDMLKSSKCNSNDSIEKKDNLLHFCRISVLIKLIRIIL